MLCSYSGRSGAVRAPDRRAPGSRASRRACRSAPQAPRRSSPPPSRHRRPQSLRAAIPLHHPGRQAPDTARYGRSSPRRCPGSDVRADRVPGSRSGPCPPHLVHGVEDPLRRRAFLKMRARNLCSRFPDASHPLLEQCPRVPLGPGIDVLPVVSRRGPAPRPPSRPWPARSFRGTPSFCLLPPARGYPAG